MFQKLNKKIFFRISLFVSSFLALLIGSSKDNGGALTQALDIPLGSIETTYAYDSGDCSGSSDGGIAFPSTGIGTGIQFGVPTNDVYTCGGSDGGGDSAGGSDAGSDSGGF
jgi:hypothetical protein